MALSLPTSLSDGDHLPPAGLHARCLQKEQQIEAVEMFNAYLIALSSAINRQDLGT